MLPLKAATMREPQLAPQADGPRGLTRTKRNNAAATKSETRQAAPIARGPLLRRTNRGASLALPWLTKTCPKPEIKEGKRGPPYYL